MRIFRSLLQKGSIPAASDALHYRLEDALEALAFVQNGPEQTKEDQLKREEAREEIIDVLRDIASALIGREISFTTEQPISEDGPIIETYLKAKFEEPTVTRDLTIYHGGEADLIKIEGAEGYVSFYRLMNLMKTLRRIVPDPCKDCGGEGQVTDEECRGMRLCSTCEGTRVTL